MSVEVKQIRATQRIGGVLGNPAIVPSDGEDPGFPASCESVDEGTNLLLVSPRSGYPERWRAEV